MSITAHKLCHQTCTKRNNSWPTIDACGINVIPSIYMAGLGVAICSYNTLGIQMYVGQTKEFFEVWSKKMKAQHNLATSRSQMCTGARPPFPRIPLHQTEILNRDMGIQIEWKRSQCWCPGRLVWMTGTWSQIKLINVKIILVETPSFFLTSVQCSQ